MPPVECEYLIISRNNFAELGTALFSLKPSFCGLEAVIFSFEQCLPLQIRSLFGGSRWAEKRLMDRAHFLLQEDPLVQQALYNEFFEFIAADYESLIDPHRNIQNIGKLLSELSRLLGGLTGKLIMDFGCGTGLSIAQLRRTSARFIGVDQSAHMREIASHRGMDVLDPKQVQDQNLLFDGGIASYVMHMISNDVVIGSVVAALKPGGVFVANYHKECSVEWANQAFSSHGCKVLPLEAESTTHHGSYFAYVRQ